MLPARATAINNPWWIQRQLREDPEMLSLIIPKAGVPTHHLVMDTTLRSLAPAADPESPYWVPRAIALYIGRKYTHVEPFSISKQTPANISKQESDPYPSSDKTGPGIQIFEVKITSETLQSLPHCYSDEETGTEQSPGGLLALGPSCLHLTVQPYTTRCHFLSLQP